MALNSVDFILYPLAIAGIYAIAIFLYDNLKSPMQVLFNIFKMALNSTSEKSFVEKYGEWAVITGATDGIGKQYAMELAHKRLNICLVSRTESKLISTAKELEDKYVVRTKWIVADLGQGKAAVDHIIKEIGNLPVGILINNAGLMYEFPDNFENVPENTLWDLINVNMASLTMLTRAIIPIMKTQQKGIIINISSGSAMQPIPYSSVYGASKVYVKNFSLALQYELAPYGIDVQLVTPMFVRTKMNHYSTTVMKGNIFCPDVESYTKQAVFMLGKSTYTSGYWAHGLQLGLMKLAPEWLKTWLAGRMNLQFKEEYKAQNKTN